MADHFAEDEAHALSITRDIVSNLGSRSTHPAAQAAARSVVLVSVHVVVAARNRRSSSERSERGKANAIEKFEGMCMCRSAHLWLRQLQDQ